MHIYRFPIGGWRTPGLPEAPASCMPIDLDYIVSVSPIQQVRYTGANIGESYAYFVVYIKLGQPFEVIYKPGTTIAACPKEMLDTFEAERLKLIDAWEYKSFNERRGAFDHP